MTAQPDWLLKLGEKFTTNKIHEGSPKEWEIFVPSKEAFAVLAYLKNLDQGAFVHLADLSAYDDHPESPRFHVFYELISMEMQIRTRIVAIIENNSAPEIKSVTSLWKGANWLEREVFDMYGISFSSHPDQRRILMPPSFKGNPLRKDFVVDYRQEFEKTSSDEEIFDPFGSTVVKGAGE